MDRTYRVPSSTRRESIRSAARVTSRSDVVEQTGVRIQDRIQEPKLRLARLDPCVVHVCYDTCKRRTGAAGPIYKEKRLTGIDDVVLALGGDIGEAPSGSIELASVRSAEGVQVRLDCTGLIGRARKYVREAA